jgi:hypothetical protein
MAQEVGARVLTLRISGRGPARTGPLMGWLAAAEVEMGRWSGYCPNDWMNWWESRLTGWSMRVFHLISGSGEKMESAAHRLKRWSFLHCAMPFYRLSEWSLHRGEGRHIERERRKFLKRCDKQKCG